MGIVRGLVFFMMSIILINQYAPMIGQHYRAKAANEAYAIVKAKQETARKIRMCEEMPFLKVCKPTHHTR